MTGEIAQMVLDGEMSEDGEWIGDIPDHNGEAPIERSRKTEAQRAARRLRRARKRSREKAANARKAAAGTSEAP